MLTGGNWFWPRPRPLPRTGCSAGRFWTCWARFWGRWWNWCPLKWMGAGRAKGSSPGITKGGRGTGGTLNWRGGMGGWMAWWGIRCRWGLSKVRLLCSVCWAVIGARCGEFRGVSALQKKSVSNLLQTDWLRKTTYINATVKHWASKKQPICSSYAIKPK